MIQKYDTVIIGGGQAGLSVSYFLTQHDCDHTILEKNRIGEAWRSERWDSFTLVTPNWMLQLPGFSYAGDNPDGFLKRDEVVQYLEDYVAKYNLPVQTGITVTSVEGEKTGEGFILETDKGQFQASNVVVATGTFRHPKIPPIKSKFPPEIDQIHSMKYRNPDEVPPGSVLIVGSAQSGCQIAEELNAAGREVYLCTGSADRLPRRYRGKDSFWWAEKLGIFDQSVDSLPTSEARFDANPQVTGKDGGRTLSLHHLARDGVNLLGSLIDAEQNGILLADNLRENIAQADKFADEFRKGVDQYVEKSGMNVPEENYQQMHDAYGTDFTNQLSLQSAGISTVIWATGYSYDFSWIEPAVLDESGYPVQNRGVTETPGLYFAGLHWLHNRKSALLLGVGDDAEHVSNHITG